MSQKFKDLDKEEEQDEEFSAGFQIPDTKSIQDRLDASSLEIIRQDHEIKTAEVEKESDKKDNKNDDKKRQQQRRGGTICYCQAEGCRIGPFIERRG